MPRCPMATATPIFMIKMLGITKMEDGDFIL